jgi:transposase-like protein
MKCPECQSDKISKRGKRYNKSGEKQLYLCTICHRKFIEQDGFERMRHDKKHIVRAIHMHNDGLSLFQVKNHLWQYDGVKISRESVRCWTKKYSTFLKSDKSAKAKVKRKATLR